MAAMILCDYPSLSQEGLVITLKNLLLQTKIAISKTWKFFAGGIVTLVAFFGNFMDYRQPAISVEITAVTTTSADPIDIIRITDLSLLKEMLDLTGPIGIIRLSSSTGREPGLPVDEIERQISIQTGNIQAEGTEIERHARNFDLIISGSKQDQETQLIELENLLTSPFDRVAGNTPNDNSKLNPQEKVEALGKRIRKILETRRKTYAEKKSKAEEAIKQWSQYKEKILPNKARLILTAAIGNQGSGATSLKPQGLLRANLGDGNYLDLPMKLSGYENSGDLGVLPARAYKVMRYQSDEVQSMNPADRLRYSTFLGNVSPATLYITDVRGNQYASNSVPFSPGVYEQKVYDSLKQFASRQNR
ncbi:hypothetical protein ACFPPF_12755 [Xenophilus aerolatus]|nr:hypothetical protein [Xenophilus aerolatus]